MAVQYSTTVRDAQANAIESTIGTAPTLEIWTGTKPADCAAADSGTKIAEGTLPSDWLTASSSGTVGKNDTWTLTGLTAASTGTNAGHFRLRKTGTVHIQGSITVTGGGGDMTLDNISIADAQGVTVTQFDLTRGNE